jgi:type IV pilus assembly protein PilV
MAAMVIMMVGVVGLLQAVIIATEHNLKNQIREEVTRIADGTMNDMRTGVFASVTGSSYTVPSHIGNTSRRYAVRKTVTAMSSGPRQYQVDVSWKYKNYSATHSIVSVRGAP